MVRSKILIGSLVAITSLSAFVLTSTTVSAEDEPYSETYTKTALIRVQSACTFSGAVSTPHTINIPTGSYRSDIGETVFSVVCNDAGGFGVYAIGYTGDTDGNNKLVNTTDSTIFINTGTATSGDNSAWAMKLTAVENDSTPTIHDGYNNYSVVPDNYVKVASYPSATTASAASIFKSSYASYISTTQATGTYQGQVKYVMVHPATAGKPGTFDAAFAMAGKTKDTTSNKYKMQDMNTSICNDVNNGQETELVDIRDGTVYHVGKMLDGRCWMQDNLALDPTQASVQANLTPSTTNATQAAIDNFVTSSGTAPQAGWATTAVSYETSSSKWDQPRINVDSKELTNLSDTLTDANTWKYGVYYNYCAASIGTYCYANGQGIDPVPTSDIDVENDVCPAGWRMPTGGNTVGGEYRTLHVAYPAISGGDDQYTRFRKAFRLPLSGRFNNGFAEGRGSSGHFWSSTYRTNRGMYYLYVDVSSISHYNNDRTYGYTIRCVAK